MCCPKEVGCPKDVVYTVIFYLSTYYSLPALPFSTFHFTTHSPFIIFNLTLLLFITFNLTPQPSFTFCFFLYSPSLYQNIPPILFKLATLPYFEIPSHFPDLLFLSLTFPSLYYIPPIITFLFIFYLYSSTLPFIIFHITTFSITPLTFIVPLSYSTTFILYYNPFLSFIQFPLTPLHLTTFHFTTLLFIIFPLTPSTQITFSIPNLPFIIFPTITFHFIIFTLYYTHFKTHPNSTFPFPTQNLFITFFLITSLKSYQSFYLLLYYIQSYHSKLIFFPFT